MKDDVSIKSRTKAQFDTIAAEYDVGPGCFAHFGKRLVEAAEIKPGQRVLDVASGRGAVLFPCVERTGRTGEVIGIDLAEEMARATNVDATNRGISVRVQVMDAEDLDFADATFDRVLCGFGLMFFPHQLHALTEFRRVLKIGGRLAVSTWCISQTNEIEAAMVELGMPMPKPPGWITEPDDLSKLLTAAGFASASVKSNSHSFRYNDADEYWRQAGGTGMRHVLDQLGAADEERLRAALARRVSRGKDKAFHSQSTALIAVGIR
jgi:ubiquinone/menaquinone biosynthesis C-methylase UbiE